jgi:hypothetical protein
MDDGVCFFPRSPQYDNPGSSTNYNNIESRKFLNGFEFGNYIRD